ncbi:hypothetical protein C4D60_Mb08t26070 [Musa balbisiana]|uniref:Uncharacterized protein n=1 Tax=Musa balbisiana TaxID=52838 RepID=A0A4S8K6L3_MUSBA|nr:hypothetical protein C4D60_Mb08t26070 [Musa balbisiana]
MSGVFSRLSYPSRLVTPSKTGHAEQCLSTDSDSTHRKTIEIIAESWAGLRSTVLNGFVQVWHRTIHNNIVQLKYLKWGSFPNSTGKLSIGAPSKSKIFNNFSLLKRLPIEEIEKPFSPNTKKARRWDKSINNKIMDKIMNPATSDSSIVIMLRHLNHASVNKKFPATLEGKLCQEWIGRPSCRIKTKLLLEAEVEVCRHDQLGYATSQDAALGKARVWILVRLCMGCIFLLFSTQIYPQYTVIGSRFEIHISSAVEDSGQPLYMETGTAPFDLPAN